MEFDQGFAKKNQAFDQAKLFQNYEWSLLFDLNPSSLKHHKPEIFWLIDILDLEKKNLKGSD